MTIAASVGVSKPLVLPNKRRLMAGIRGQETRFLTGPQQEDYTNGGTVVRSLALC